MDPSRNVVTFVRESWEGLPVDIDAWSNFFSGWADAMTGGGTGYLRGALGLSQFIDRSSGTYMAGSLVGCVHGFLLGGAAGNAAHTGFAFAFARGMTAISTVSGVAQGSQNIINGQGTVMDIVSIMPAAGFVAGKLTNGLGVFRCFVGDGRVIADVQDATAPIAEPMSADGLTLSLGTATIFAGMTAGIIAKRRNEQEEQDQMSQATTRQSAGPARVSPPDDNLFLFAPEKSPATMPSEPLFDFGGGLPPTDATALDGASPTREIEVMLASPTKPFKARKSWTAALATAVALCALGAGLVWNGLTGGSAQRAQAAAPAGRIVKSVAIRDFALGRRCVGTNPLREQVEHTPEPDQAIWREVHLLLKKPNGGNVRCELLRPLEWLIAHAAQIVTTLPSKDIVQRPLMVPVGEAPLHELLLGRTIQLDLPELGASGPAEIVSIGPCPDIEPDDGKGRHVVTGRFIHSPDGKLLDILVEGESSPTGVTANHPYWSVSRHEFVEAGKLQVGEKVNTLNGTRTIASITPRPQAETVYNLEVHGEHVYRVGDIGTLVHNAYVPSPNGSRGSLAHQQMIDNVEARLTNSNKWQTVAGGSMRERMYGNRRPDLVLEDGLGGRIAVQVGRRNSGNLLPVARERRALNDLNNLIDPQTGNKMFDHVFFVEY